MNRWIEWVVLSAVLALVSAGSGFAQHAISFSFTDNGDSGSQSGYLDASELAGASGVRVANWNNVQTRDGDGIAVFDGVLGDDESVWFDDGSVVGGGLTITPSTYNFSDRINGSYANDREMYNGVKDAFGGNFSVAVTNVPFGAFDVYCYMLDDGAGRIGTFTIGETTYYCRGGVGMPDSNGNGYVISVDTESVAPRWPPTTRGITCASVESRGTLPWWRTPLGWRAICPATSFAGFRSSSRRPARPPTWYWARRFHPC